MKTSILFYKTILPGTISRGRNKLEGLKQSCTVLFLYCLAIPLLAQPSGGPYGPLLQKYEVPAVTGKIYYVSADGKAENSGESLSQPTSIEAAFEQVSTGDAIILRGGIYRTGNLILNQGITIQPYGNEQPVLKGTFIADSWKNLGNGIWVTKWTNLFPSKPDTWWQRDREGKETPQYKFNNDMVFVDGKFLQAVGWEGEVNENTYYINYESGQVYIGTDPANKLVEITAFNVALNRVTDDCHGKKSDHKGPVIRGITFTQYAYRAIEVEGTEPEAISPEADHGKEVTGTILENCEISYCSRVAAYLRGDRLTIRHCKVSNTSTEGIYIIASSDVLLEKNIFSRNNIERITGYFPAAVKIFNQCYRVTCRDNLVIDLPFSNGIWYDVGNVDGVFINNWIEGVGSIDYEINKDRPWPSDNGFFFEISKGAICAGNVFVNCDHGVWALNSSNVQFYNNTFINSIACIGRDGRNPAEDHFGWHSSTAPDVDKREGHIFVNNLLTADENFKRPLLYTWQPPVICDRVTKPQFKQIDNNLYIQSNQTGTMPLILWSPATGDRCMLELNSPETIHKLYPGFSTNCRYLDLNLGNVFKSPELGNYKLLNGFNEAASAMMLPAEISALLGLKKKDAPYIGAYPLVP
jgi:parallel beta-helix repeat protein